MLRFISSTGRPKIFGWMAIAAILFLSKGLMAGTLEHTIRTGPFEIQEGPDGQEIRAADYGTLTISGKPKVPYKIFAFALPPGAEVLSVDPLHLDEYGYGSYDFRIPNNVSVGTKYIQAGTKMNAYRAKTNQESFEIE